MTERDSVRRQGASDEGGLHAPPDLGLPGKLWWWFHFAVLVKLARLRFIAVLAGVGAVIACWDTLGAYYEKWTRPVFGQDTAANSDTEWWCPMDPTVVRDRADKCPICGMPLAPRKKGEKRKDEAQPPGVLSRVALTPYKAAVAGIETAEIGYRPLAKEIDAVGFVEFDERKLARIGVRAAGKSRIDRLFANVTGQMVAAGDPLAEVYSPELAVTAQHLLDARAAGNSSLEGMARDRLRLWGIDAAQIHQILEGGKPVTHLTIRSPISGHVIKKYQVEGEYVEEGARLYDVADLSSVWIEAQVYEDEVGFLHGAVEKKLPVVATTKSFPNREFKGEVAFLHPHLDGSTRTLKVRFDLSNPRHDLRPGMYATVRLQVPVAQLDLLPADAGDREKQAWRQGEVLAVPERAVIDTGRHKFVYREAEPDVYEGIEVELGPRCGEFYPVVRGLHAGDRVATTGSFLIDAETRLTAGAGSTYFGARGGPRDDSRPATTAARPSMTRDADEKVRANLAKLSAEDRRLAEAQRFCPVQPDNRLGGMGVPVAVEIKGRKVFLCCKGCKDEALENPDQTLARVEQLEKGVHRPEAPARGDKP